MSIESMALVLHHSKAKGTRKVVLLGVANHDGDGGAYPTVDTLARYANVDERNVQRAIEWLVSAGELAVEQQNGGDRDCPEHLRPNRYRVKVSCPTWCDHTAQHRDTRRLAGGQLTLLGDQLRRGGVRATPPGGASATPPGGASATQTVHTNHPPTPPQLDDRPCTVCGQGQARCQAQQQSWSADDRHSYRPLAGHTRAHAPAERRTRASR